MPPLAFVDASTAGRTGSVFERRDRVPGAFYTDDYGIKFDADDANAAANTAAFNQAFTDMETPSGGAGGGLLLGPRGVAKVNNTVKLRNGCTMRGIWKGGTQIRAAASFPINTPVVRLGDGVHDIGLTFGCRLEYMSVHCNSIAGSVGVYSTDCQEGSGLFHVGVFSHKNVGIWFDGNGCSQYGCEELEVYGDGCNQGIYLKNTAGNSTVNWVTVSDPTGVGIQCEGGGSYNLKQIHCEGPTGGDGIYIPTGNVMIDGVIGNASNLNLVHIGGGTGSVVVQNLYTEGSPHAIVDDLNGRTIDDPYVPYYNQGTLYIGNTKLQSGTAPPGGGARVRGEIFWNSQPSAGGFIGWVCTASGTPGTWKTFGAITP